MKTTFKIFFVFPILFMGCDIFTTRDAEIPLLPRDSFQTAVTPEILIENFVNSLRDKNPDNYVVCFADSSFSTIPFLFSPSSEALSQFPDLLNDWTVKNERQYFINIANKITADQPMTLVLDQVNQSLQGDSVFYEASYALNVPHTDQFPVNYAGVLRFNIKRDSRAVYVISFWQDIKNGELPTWSELKGRYY
ncbi:MAG: hypothetical protein IPH11_17980 [Ignavibacteriales bacterium]|nr:hypothetical protein [Ignavibacteriales bacterium]